MYEDLNHREIEILQLIADHHTNREIAEHLHLSVETINWYAKRIYITLDVKGRKQAVQKARELGLLEIIKQPQDLSPLTVSHNLPIQLTDFVGRHSQIQDIITKMLKIRLLTLTGPGGIGKTRLSLQVAERVLDDFPDGVYFVDLAPLRSGDNVAKAIASALGISEKKDASFTETLQRTIGHRNILLIIDNFEHMIADVAIISDLLATTSTLKILVTSRESLRVMGENEYPVPPLSIHDSESEASLLFVQRVQMIRPDFRLNEGNITDIMTICKRLDGLPLAIELAAAQCKLLTPHALLKRLEDRPDFLVNRARNVPQRQQTLQAAIDWSYQLLTADEQLLFMRLSVFNGGRSLEAIEMICADGLTTDIFSGLTSLIDKSMIKQVVDDLGEPRFMMLQTLKEFAYQQLKYSGEHKLIQSRHAIYFMELTERGAPQLRRADQVWWFKKFEIEQNNLRTAMRWALSSNDNIEIGVRIVASLRDYWWYQGYTEESWRWIQPALDCLDQVSDAVRANLLLTAGNLAYFRGDIDACIRYGAEALAIYQALDDKRGIAWSSNLPALDIRRPIESRIQMNRHALTLMREIDDLPGQTNMLNVLGLLLTQANDFENAILAFEECIDIARQTGEKRREAIVLGCLAEIALQQGQYTTASTLFYDSLKLGRDLQFPFHLHDLLWMCIVLLVELDRLESAMILFGAAKSREQLTGQSIFPLQVEYVTLPFQSLEDQRTTSPTHQVIYEKGYKMSLNEAVDFILSELSES